MNLRLPRSLLVCAIFAFGASKLAASTAVVVSVADQKLALVQDGTRVAEYKISTSQFGLGDKSYSYNTPLGKLEVADRIGDGLPAGAVLKGRHATGEILNANAQGRDPIVTRILHLRGLESCNENAFARGIYIHGTPVERQLGKPVSWGCIRMRSKDVIALFDAVPVGTPVEIMNAPLRVLVKGMLLATRPPVTPPLVAAISAVAKTAKNAITSDPKIPPVRPLATISTKPMYSEPEKSSPSHSAMAPVGELPTLGGAKNLHASQHRETADHRGIGLSLSLR